MKKFLVYDNRTGIANKLMQLLEQDKMDMSVAESFPDFINYLQSSTYELVLLDIDLEEYAEAGLNLIREIRSRSLLPVIVVSQVMNEENKIAAFSCGADDYVDVECNPLELLARIDCQITRYRQLVRLCDNISTIYRVDGLVIDDMQRKVMVDDREAKLTPLEYEILKLLVQEKGNVVTIQQIYERIWHMKAIGADNIVAVHIRHIREKIEANPKQPRYLKLVWGNGYKVG